MLHDTKYVLKSCAIAGFYSGGKPCHRGSVNRCFFGVNIAFFIFSHSLNRRKRSLFSIVSRYLSVIREVLLKWFQHVLIVYGSGYPWVITPRLVVDFCADGGDHFTGGYLDKLFTEDPAKGWPPTGGRRFGWGGFARR